jgi:chitinase
MLFRLIKVILIVAYTVVLLSNSMAQLPKRSKYIVNGYVGGFRGLVDTKAIKAEKLTHINYAFVNVKDSMAVLTNLKTDSTNFRNLTALKSINPGLKILISIGGWIWSGNFSDAVLTPSSRKLFAKSSVDIVREYKLDGVDIDWEYPAMKGYEGNIVRDEDRENYTLMFKEIRLELDKLTKETGKEYQLTTAVGGSKSFIQNTEMAEVAKIVDYVYVMTYDYGGHGGKIGHHTNLYPTDMEIGGSSADGSIKDFMAAGVPAHKLVLGAGFYGKAWVAEGVENNGLGQISVHSSQNQGLAKGQGGGYTKIKDTMIDQDGYKRYWDKKAKAPYLFNHETKVFVTYEDEKSVKEKANYVKKNHLAGLFFWEYFEDPKEYLLNVIDKTLP